MRSRAKCLRVLSGRTLTTESGVGVDNFMMQIDKKISIFASMLQLSRL